MSPMNIREGAGEIVSLIATSFLTDRKFKKTGKYSCCWLSSETNTTNHYWDKEINFDNLVKELIELKIPLSPTMPTIAQNMKIIITLDFKEKNSN